MNGGAHTACRGGDSGSRPGHGTQDLPTVLRSMLARRERRQVGTPSLRCAAVLVPLRLVSGEWYVVVTQRTQTVDHHKGQISFPGGACDSADADATATALREAFEEIGLPPEDVEVLGLLDDLSTITHFRITPVVGLIRGPVHYQTNQHEVDAIVEVPLSFLLDPSHLRTEPREHEGQVYQVLMWDYGPYTIWGATARILKGLLEMVSEANGRPYVEPEPPGDERSSFGPDEILAGKELGGQSE